MAGPLQAAGAAPEPTEYAPLTMDRYITGLWTQRSPLRDADVPYLYGKFYSASRFDSLIDGLNREVSAKLTMIRRPGFSVWNSQNFPPIRSYYPFKFMQDGTQQLRVIVDTDTAVYDATPPNTKTLLFNKSAGAGRTRFLGLGSELFMTDGVDQKKFVQSNKTWKASTQFNAGDFIVDPAGNLQYILPNSQAVATITNVEVRQVQKAHVGPFYYVLILTFTQPHAPVWTTGTMVSFAGLTTYTTANGKQISYQPVDNTLYNLGLLANQSAFFWTGPTYGPAADTGTVTGGSTDAGITGPTQPAWNETLGGTTPDGSALWTCGGSQVQNWTLTGPTPPPAIINSGADRYWQPYANLGLYYACYDANKNLEVIVGNPGPGNTTGPYEPAWAKNQGGYTYDGSYQWINCGNIGSWAANNVYTVNSAILDSNGNLQIASAVVLPGETGALPPSWSTALGTLTVDNNITWVCAGPGVTLAYGNVSYCYAWEGIDGSVSTASPLAVIPNGVLGTAGGYSVTLAGLTPVDPQCILIDIFRTAQGGATPLLLTKIPNPFPGVAGTWTFTDTLPDSALNEFEIAPIDHANDPAPPGATAPTLHLQRVFMLLGSKAIWSGGPDTLVGNGYTAFPPANVMDFGELLTKSMSLTTNQGAALVIVGTANSYAILGNATPAAPLTPVKWMEGVGALSYDAITVVGSTPYIYTNNKKFVSLDPSAGYVEAGFPIGDQLDVTTTGGFNGKIFDPALSYVTWYEKKSGDSAIYLANGAGQWFRYSPVASPESGYLWSPLGAITGGGSAMQAVETSTGKFDLLIGPAVNGPILKRDTSINNDNGALYPSSMTMGNIVLCESGEVAEVAHIGLDSMKEGDRPTVGMLYGEIKTTANIDFDTLVYTSVDPPTLDESETLYSDRYVTTQDGVCPKCTHCQIKIDWGSQDVPDELLGHAIFGAKFSERKQAS